MLKIIFDDVKWIELFFLRVMKGVFKNFLATRIVLSFDEEQITFDDDYYNNNIGGTHFLQFSPLKNKEKKAETLICVYKYIQGSEEYYKYKLLDISKNRDGDIAERQEGARKCGGGNENTAPRVSLECEDEGQRGAEKSDDLQRNELPAKYKRRTESMAKFRKEKLEQAMDTFNKMNEQSCQMVVHARSTQAIVGEFKNKNALDKTKQIKCQQLLGDILNGSFCMYNTYWQYLIELDLATRDHNNTVITFGVRTDHRLLTFSQMNDMCWPRPNLWIMLPLS
ncbi:hypothetical protein RFI_21517 [Reticulomyxa filosa]|uniref:Uncharacterized protein n=1 Tax=Reticulomyxa filosa TaxID=46433 RepID=X6MQY3_RETFI|nr:hypothetical protein RFI_21517 [Reticulomyxa filosa]|eukprot:ETO15847.1 hypothetical protein RFI_21517 [Reticulomyxa filosa]